MKKRIVVEIEVPDVSDLCWKLDVTGIQAFSETVMLYARSNTVRVLSEAYEYCEKHNIKGEQKENFLSHVNMKCEMIQNADIVGYLNGENVFIDKF